VSVGRLANDADLRDLPLDDEPRVVALAPRPGNGPLAGPSHPFRTLSFAELRDRRHEPPDRAAIGTPKVGLVCNAGSPKVGKTTYEMQLAVAMAAPDVTEFLGDPVITGPVLLVIEEGSLDGISWRIRRQAEYYSVDADDLAIEVAHRQRVRLDDRRSVRALRDHIRSVRPVRVTVDPLNRCHGQDENKPTAMTPVMDALSDISAEFACSVGMVHHLSKPSQERRGSVWDRFRGASSIRSATDGNLALDGNGRGGIRLQGEFRDSEPLDMWLTFDRDRLVFEAVERPAAPSKVPQILLRAFVEENEQVTAKDVMARFKVSRHTALDALEAGGFDHFEGQRGTLVYLPGTVQ